MPEPQTSTDDSTDELRVALDAARSLRTIRRFVWKVAFFALFAAAHAGAGRGFFAQFASFALLATVLGLALGHWHRERVSAPHYTHFDEAAWLMLLAGLADRLAA